MAEKEATPPPKSSAKELIFFGLFFIVSFILTFGVLYVAMRGVTNPFSNVSKVGTADSTATTVEPVGDKQTPKTASKEIKIDSAQIKAVEAEQQNEIQRQVRQMAQDEILKREEEIEELKQQVETLKFAYEENRRRYYDLRSTSVSGDSLADLIADLESEKKNVKQQEETIAEMDSVTQRLKSLIANKQLEDTTGTKIDVDSLNKVLAKLDSVRQEKQAQQASIDALKKQVETFETEKQVAQNVNVKQLAKVYDAMKPAEAAAIISKLDNELVVSLLKMVKKRQAAKIMAALPAERAAKLSQLIGTQ
ncbi:hypothetical protein JW960_01865 [candidate division KSB1 bacterium]|nr:hypothetical protein [candidate division KSB1 bacterium]